MSFSAAATGSTSGLLGAGAGAWHRAVYSAGSGLGSAVAGGGKLEHDASVKHAASAAVSSSVERIFKFLGRGDIKLCPAGQRLAHRLAGLSGLFDQPLMRLKQPIEFFKVLSRVVGCCFGDAFFVAIDVAANSGHKANGRNDQNADGN